MSTSSGPRRRISFGSRSSHSTQHNPGSYLYSHGGAQYSTARKKTGINRKTAQIVKVLNHQELKCRVLQWKALRPFDGVMGFNFLAYREEVAGKAQYLAPLFIMDLMHKDYAGTTGLPHPAYMLRQKAGAVDWLECWSQNNTNGGTARGWNLKHQSMGFPTVTSANPLPDSEKLHYGKANIALNLYGQKNRAVDFTVMLVKFSDQDVAPHNDYYVSNSNNTEHDIFWGQMLKEMVANPIAKDNKSYMDRMQVLKRKVIHIEPAGTTDSDINPHVVTLNWSHGIHKTIDHVERIVQEDAAADLVNEQIVNPNVVTQLMGPKVKDRVYLVIKANVYSMVPVSVGTITNEYAPSFDLNVHVSQYATKG